jgi:two-component system, NtrC family, nitrogen regulation sensor histidine kinase NtrY
MKRALFTVSLWWRLSLSVIFLIVLAVVLTLNLKRWIPASLKMSDASIAVVVLLVLVPISLLLLHRQIKIYFSLFRALAGTVSSYRDADYSFSIRWQSDDEVGELVKAHNALGNTLREQRLNLVQRELLLDTMAQNTPVAMFLRVDSGPIVYSNLAARRLLNNGKKLEGFSINALLATLPIPLAEAFERGGDGLFSIGEDDAEEVYHLARRTFRLNGRAHELILLRQLTTELRRQEVQTWKKVIRVLSHELNNSLAPIASLAHSGAELVRREQYQRLEEIFSTVEERARHLEGFIRDYAHFAKLPNPRLEAIDWPRFIARLSSQIAFKLEGALPEKSTPLDVAQMEQALINLLKNAAESDTAIEEVKLSVRIFGDTLLIDVMDRGQGMTEAVLTNALIPFYSTKRSGTGLGLALTREIVEAHGGRIALSNRTGGGLQVSISLPTK